MLKDTRSPKVVRLSTAADIALGFSPGGFYCNAKLGCINLLQYYPEGCKANCSYCGQARENPKGSECKSLIRVQWPLRSLGEITERIRAHETKFSRICVSQICRDRAASDTVTVISRLRGAGVSLPISVLVSPTVTNKGDLLEMKRTGASMAGIAIDAATPKLFDKCRGKSAGGPHRWNRYMDGLIEAVEVFGLRKAGVHLIVGLGENERDLVNLFLKIRDMGSFTHLFSFYPEEGSKMERRKQPLLNSYRRVQLSRYIIDNCGASLKDFSFDESGRLVDIRLNTENVIAVDCAFRTSGCPGCNRPFANERPSQNLRNYPWKPSPKAISTALYRTCLPIDCLIQFLNHNEKTCNYS
ncbi:MAG: radical SAM protein [Candidatus Bathyarchaeota archaeon]